MTVRIFKRPNSPFWQYRFWENGRQPQRSTRETNEAKAQRIADQAFHDAELRRRGEEPEPTVQVLTELWVEQFTPFLSTSHVGNVFRFGQLHLGPLKNLRLSQVTTRLAEEALKAYRTTHAQGSCVQWVTYLRLVYKWAIARNMIRTVPWALKIKRPKKVPKRRLPTRKTTPFFEVVDRLCQGEPGIALAIRIMTGLGLRGSEVRQGRWEWLDWERATYTPGGTKGGEAEPRPVPPWLLEELLPCHKVAGLLVATRDGKPLTVGRIQRVLDHACQEVDIPRLTGHRLRGTYATWLSEEHLPIQDIQLILGQKDIRTTAGYLETDRSRVVAAQARIAQKTGLDKRKTSAQQAANPLPF
jgi:integrase